MKHISEHSNNLLQWATDILTYPYINININIIRFNLHSDSIMPKMNENRVVMYLFLGARSYLHDHPLKILFLNSLCLVANDLSYLHMLKLLCDGKHNFQETKLISWWNAYEHEIRPSTSPLYLNIVFQMCLIWFLMKFKHNFHFH